jgi:hypothetical protein
MQVWDMIQKYTENNKTINKQAGESRKYIDLQRYINMNS